MGILVGLICWVLIVGFTIYRLRTGNTSYEMASNGAFVIAGIAALFNMVHIFILCDQLYSRTLAILLSIMSVFGCVGLLILLMINHRATELLEDHGYEVGLLGAK